MSPIIHRLRKLIVLGTFALTATAAASGEPHRWGCRNCPPYSMPNFGYNPPTWRPWPTVCAAPVEQKLLEKEAPELAPPPKPETPEAKPAVPGPKPTDALPPVPQPLKKSSDPKEAQVPKSEARSDSPSNKSPYYSWHPSPDPVR